MGVATAYEQLRNLGKSRQYKECAQLLQAVIQLMAHFKSYRSINQIAVLNRNVADLERELLEQVCEDFELVFAKAELPLKASMLSEACLVIEALGEQSKSRLITWYCNTQLREYRQVFRGSEEAGSLDNITRRYAWLKRILKTYDEEHAQIFPPSWKVNEILTHTFCDNTKEDFKGILARSTRSTQRLDVNLLLSCLQETLDLEQWLDKKFTLGPDHHRRSLDAPSPEENQGFGKAISIAFEPYLSLWVEAQDRQLASMIAKYRLHPLQHTDDELTSTSVLPSSIDLFKFYSLSLSHCTKLSTGTALLELSRAFTRHLDSYASSVLQHLLTQPIGVLEIVVILNTADYCSVTSGQLGSKIASKIAANLASNISFEPQQETFLGVVNSSLKTLVGLCEQPLEPALREMRNMPWSRMGIVGDSSSYVTEMVRVAQDQGFKVLSLLSKDAAYARAYAERLAEHFAQAFLSSVIAVKPITEIAAEQLLLDLYSIKKCFEDLLSLSPLYSKNSEATIPASYTRHLQVIFSRATALLKCLQLPAEHPSSLAQAFLIHHSTRSRTALSRFLELKGLKSKSEQSPFLEAFSARVAEMPEDERAKLGGDEHWLANLNQGPKEEAQIKSTNALESVGRTLLNRARDGVDRLGKEDGESSVGRGFGRFFQRP